MKLNNFLHLFHPDPLANYLAGVGGFPTNVDRVSLSLLCFYLLSKDIREIELFVSGYWRASIFWTYSGLVLTHPEPGEAVIFQPDIIVVSAFYDSKFSYQMSKLGIKSATHPFVDNPEWIECYVFRV